MGFFASRSKTQLEIFDYGLCKIQKWREKADMVDNSQYPCLSPVLTDREIEILRLIGKGETNAQIALELSISVRTVRSHIERVMHKLKVRNRTEAVIKAIKSGLLEL